jgi:hypothetical protein
MANAQRLLEFGWPPLYAVAGDDCHSLEGSDQASPGRGWIVVRAAHLQTSELLQAMVAGDFYASTGVVLTQLQYDSKHGLLSISALRHPRSTYRIDFIATKRHVMPLPSSDESWDSPGVGVVVKSVPGWQGDYRLASDDLYVRATITASLPVRNPMRSNYAGDRIQVEQAFTQPVGWK